MVCFRYRPEVDEAGREDHRQRLRSLSGLDGVVELRVGADLVRSARSFDTGLLVRFRDRGALDAYQKDPRHVPVARLGVELSEQIVAVDFDE